MGSLYWSNSIRNDQTQKSCDLKEKATQDSQKVKRNVNFLLNKILVFLSNEEALN